MRILGIDIETSPHMAHVWSLWKQNISLSQLEVPTDMLCFAAKWFGEKPVQFYSVYHSGREEMVAKAHALLDEADVVVHYYGKRFDIPHLNRCFIQAGLNPPAPYKQVDLKEVAARKFKFASNKLQHVSTELGLEGKTSHTGFQLWLDCMAGDEKAWRLMRRYNKQDVALLEELFEKLRPWIPSLPSVALHNSNTDAACPGCGSDDLRKEGLAYTQVSAFQRYQCKNCGRWSRGSKAVSRTELRDVAS